MRYVRGVRSVCVGGWVCESVCTRCMRVWVGGSVRSVYEVCVCVGGSVRSVNEVYEGCECVCGSVRSCVWVGVT